MLNRGLYFIGLLLISAFIAVKLFGIDMNNTIFKTLSGIKKISNNQVDFSALENTDTHPVSHEIWNNLLQKNVDEKGEVDYEAFKADEPELKKYLNLLSANPPNKKNWNRQQTLAYWINAYNAFTVEFIIRHYPLTSIRETAGNVPMVNSPWDIKFFKIGGIDFDLNTIEHEILRKMDEPRIHFALNCASESCPVLLDRAYTGDELDGQLTRQTKRFLHDPAKNVITGNEIQLSKIFEWYKVDFEDEGSLVSFIEKYGSEDLPDDVKIKFQNYDWSLNEKK